LTVAATQRAAAITGLGDDYRPIGRVVDERAIVNAMVGLTATGGSTNHFIHLPAIARAAGIEINWDDFAEIARVTPLLVRMYPNGAADVNHFHAAGGTAFLTRELLGLGLLHGDIATVASEGMAQYAREPWLSDGALEWRDVDAKSGDESVLRPRDTPFMAEGGLRVVTGGLGRAVIKTSAIDNEHRVVQAPARVFDTQAQVLAAFSDGKLDGDGVIVVRGQGPRANGMPELHKLMPVLGALQDRGFRVALVTDGRMSGASGKVLAAIHVIPEAVAGGPIAKVRDGDMVRVDSVENRLDVISPADWVERAPSQLDLSGNQRDYGRELFRLFRQTASSAEEGASPFPDYDTL
jgi:phosphogluconate dehydratase